MHKRGARPMPSCGVCLCVCPLLYGNFKGAKMFLSRSWVASKRINTSSKFFAPSCSQAILVFPCQTGWRYSDGNPANGGVECRWGRQKTWFWTNIWLRCIQVYTLTAASVVRCSRKTTTKCLWRARRYTPETEVKPPSGHNPLGHNYVLANRLSI